jgi:hypothetical protein
MRFTVSNTGKTITVCFDGEVYKALSQPQLLGRLKIGFNAYKSEVGENTVRYRISVVTGALAGCEHAVGRHSDDLYYASCQASKFPSWPVHGKIELDRSQIEFQAPAAFNFPLPVQLPPPQPRNKIINSGIQPVNVPVTASERHRQLAAMSSGAGNAMLCLGSNSFMFDLPDDELGKVMVEWSKRGWVI